MKLKALMLAGCILAMGMLTACGANADADPGYGAADGGKSEEEVKMEEMRALLYHEETTIEPGRYMIDGVELCDAAEAPQDTDDRWEGYTETELGLLSPDKMPNCITDEIGNHWVLYNNAMYVYVNDFNSQYGDASQFKDYANVWCVMDPTKWRILGDLYDYGEMCAQEGE